MKKFFGVIIVGVLSFQAHASFQHSDVNAQGDQLAFFDDATGLEWLHFSVTSNQSINQVRSRTQSGGDLEGWRLPSQSEVYTLMENLFPSVDFSSTNYEYIDPVHENEIDAAFTYSGVSGYWNSRSVGYIMHVNDEGGVNRASNFLAFFDAVNARRRIRHCIHENHEGCAAS